MIFRQNPARGDAVVKRFWKNTVHGTPSRARYLENTITSGEYAPYCQERSDGITDSDLRCIAANWAALGILYNTGQDCTAGSRVYVQETIYDKFVALLVSKAKQLHIGDGFDEKSGGGPVVSQPPSRLELVFSVC